MDLELRLASTTVACDHGAEETYVLLFEGMIESTLDLFPASIKWLQISPRLQASFESGSVERMTASIRFDFRNGS
jgi:hypothetical protein